jgi:hypothetical protein
MNGITFRPKFYSGSVRECMRLQSAFNRFKKHVVFPDGHPSGVPIFLTLGFGNYPGSCKGCVRVIWRLRAFPILKKVDSCTLLDKKLVVVLGSHRFMIETADPMDKAFGSHTSDDA